MVDRTESIEESRTSVEGECGEAEFHLCFASVVVRGHQQIVPWSGLEFTDDHLTARMLTGLRHEDIVRVEDPVAFAFLLVLHDKVRDRTASVAPGVEMKLNRCRVGAQKKLFIRENCTLNSRKRMVVSRWKYEHMHTIWERPPDKGLETNISLFVKQCNSRVQTAIALRMNGVFSIKLSRIKLTSVWMSHMCRGEWEKIIIVPMILTAPICSCWDRAPFGALAGRITGAHIDVILSAATKLREGEASALASDCDFMPFLIVCPVVDVVPLVGRPQSDWNC